jgi:regulatory protein
VKRKITKITVQKNQKRVNIFLDEKFGFGLDLENYVLLGLKVGQELSDEEISEITKKAEYQNTYNNLLRFATLRPRSEKEIYDWFKKHKVSENLYIKLFDKLKHLNLANDYEFAKWWIEQRIQFKSKSKKDLEYELRIKGIAKEIINEVLSESGIDELGAAQKLIKKNIYKWERLDKFKKKQKIYEFLARKGFGWPVINSILKRYLNSEIDDI